MTFLPTQIDLLKNWLCLQCLLHSSPPVHQHAFHPSAETERFGGTEKKYFVQPPVSPACWFAWPYCNIFIDILRLCLPSRGKEEHMVYHLILEIIPSLSRRGMVFPSFQSINYSCFIVFDYIYELLQIK